MKKLIALVLLLALVASLGVVFAGCGSTLKPFKIPSNGYDNSKVTITFNHTMGADYRKILDKYITEFNKLYPNITVKHNQVGGYNDVRNDTKTKLTKDNYPNMVYCYPDHVALYNSTRKVVTLDELMTSTIEITRGDGTKETLGFTPAQLADLNSDFLEEGRQFGDGKTYTLPFAKSTEVLYYNKDFFDQHAADGLEIPTHWFASDGKEGLASSDTTSMEYVCAKLQQLDSSCTPFGYDSESNWFITLCEQAGIPYTSLTGNHYQFNTATAQGYMKTLRRWFNSRYFTTGTLYNTGSSSGYTSGLFTGDDAATRSYMSIGSSAGAGNQRPGKNVDTDDYEFEVGITTIPQINADGEVVTAISQGPNVCIFNRKNPQEVVATWLFIKFLLTNRGFQYYFSEKGGYVPVIDSLSDESLRETDPAVDLYLENMANANGGEYISYLSQKVCFGLNEGSKYTKLFTSPAFPGSSTARDEVGKLLVAIVSDTTVTESGIDQFIKDKFKAAIEECEYAG